MSITTDTSTVEKRNTPNEAARGPLVINTWAFTAACATAYQVLTTDSSPASHLNAVEQGINVCQENRCDGTVGWGGSPDENGETTLDACIIDGDTMKAGSVAGLRRVKNAIAVARYISEYTKHTMLAGDLATEFALEMGFPESDLHSPESIASWQNWKANSCQPNYRQNVSPDPTTSCGPYTPIKQILQEESYKENRLPITELNHDTIGMVALTASGSVAAGCSTNGARWKVPGRIGDGPIIGSGAYADKRVGGCAATGDGDILMKFLPCLLTIENLRNGMPLQLAADRALLRVAEFVPSFNAAIVVLTPDGQFTGSAYGWTAQMSVRNAQMTDVTVYTIIPITSERGSYLVRNTESFPKFGQK